MLFPSEELYKQYIEAVGNKSTSETADANTVEAEQMGINTGYPEASVDLCPIAYLYPASRGDVGVCLARPASGISDNSLSFIGAYSQLVIRGLPLDSLEIETADGVTEAISVCGKIYIKMRICKLLFAKERVKIRDIDLDVEICTTQNAKIMLIKADDLRHFDSGSFAELYLSVHSPDAVIAYSTSMGGINAISFCPDTDKSLWIEDALRALLARSEATACVFSLDGIEYRVKRSGGGLYLNKPISHISLTSGE